jgi:hypothetical protein
MCRASAILVLLIVGKEGYGIEMANVSRVCHVVITGCGELTVRNLNGQWQNLYKVR